MPQAIYRLSAVFLIDKSQLHDAIALHTTAKIALGELDNQSTNRGVQPHGRKYECQVSSGCAWYHIMYSSNLGKKMRGPATDWKKNKIRINVFPLPGLSSSVERCYGKEFQRTEVHGVTLYGGEVYI